VALLGCQMERRSICDWKKNHQKGGYLTHHRTRGLMRFHNHTREKKIYIS
jgi:hypothetical protein